MRFLRAVLFFFLSLFAISTAAPTPGFAQEDPPQFEETLRELREQWDQLMKEEYAPARISPKARAASRSSGTTKKSKNLKASKKTTQKASVKTTRSKKESVKKSTQTCTPVKEKAKLSSKSVKPAKQQVKSSAASSPQNEAKLGAKQVKTAKKPNKSNQKPASSQ
ncbi:MAG: hypothetical protein AB2L11_05335 [Syntrophobacteraceae bacterium]